MRGDILIELVVILYGSEFPKIINFYIRRETIHFVKRILNSSPANEGENKTRDQCSPLKSAQSRGSFSNTYIAYRS